MSRIVGYASASDRHNSVLRQDNSIPFRRPTSSKRATSLGADLTGGLFRRSGRHGLTGLRKEVDVKAAWRVHDQQPPGILAVVPESVDLSVSSLSMQMGRRVRMNLRARSCPLGMAVAVWLLLADPVVLTRTVLLDIEMPMGGMGRIRAGT